MSQTGLLQLAKVDKSKYTTQTLSIIEVMACYFLNMIYNDLYLKVRDLKNANKLNNITDGYKHALFAYYRGLNDNQNLKKCIENIQRTFNELPGYSTMSFLDCINKIVQQFSADDAFDGLNDKQRRIILKTVVIDVNSAFIHHILKVRLSMIIDKRKESQNVKILKDELMDFFLLERERLITAYYGVKLNVDKTSSISNQTAERLQQIISETVKNMVMYKKQYEIYKEKSTQLEFELNQIKKKYPQLFTLTKSDNPEQKFNKIPTDNNQPSNQLLQTQQTKQILQTPQNTQTQQNNSQINIENLEEDLLELDSIKSDDDVFVDDDSDNIEIPNTKPVNSTTITQTSQIPQTSETIQTPQTSQNVQEFKQDSELSDPDHESDPFAEDVPVESNPTSQNPTVKNNNQNAKIIQGDIQKPRQIQKITLDDLVIDESEQPRKDDPLASSEDSSKKRPSLPNTPNISNTSNTSNVSNMPNNIKIKKGKINIKADAPVKKRT